MSFKFSIGQRLIIELISGEIFEGDFVTSNSSKIELINCVNLYTNTPITTLQFFYFSEIVKVNAFQNVKENTDIEHTTDNIQQISEDMQNISISRTNYEELNLLVKQYIYMPTMDSRYHDAIKALTNAETIGVAILNKNYGRLSPIDVLVLCTWNQIYLFDILLYNKKQFPEDLQYLFESEEIVKVVHDSRELVDCMYHQYKISVNNIFDTYVAANIISGETFSLPQCLTKYFNIPDAFVKEALDPNLRLKWGTRPLEEHLKKLAGIHVQYLIFLKTYLQKRLLKEFHQKVLKFSQSTLDQSPYEAQSNLH